MKKRMIKRDLKYVKVIVLMRKLRLSMRQLEVKLDIEIDKGKR